MPVQTVVCRIPRNTCLNSDPSFTTVNRKHTLVGNYICLDVKYGFPINVCQRKTNDLAKSVRSKEEGKHFNSLVGVQKVCVQGKKTCHESSCHNLNRGAPVSLSSFPSLSEHEDIC